MNEAVQEALLFSTVSRAATVSEVPPVHNNCRCVIGPDNVWTDAGDARVCVYCMTLGAAWNLRLDEVPDQQEVDDILDKQGREEFRKAIEKDSRVADAVIRDSAEKAIAGVLVDVRPAATETWTIAVEREATRRLAEARAKAPIQPFARVPGLTPIPEAVEFVPAPGGRQRPQVVQVLIAATPTHRVVRKMGRYYILTAGGRVVGSDDNLALALLILLALAENERRRNAEREKAGRSDREP